MRKLQHLILDDSIDIRRLLSDILSNSPKFENPRLALNGRLSRAKLPQHRSEFVTVDVNMTELGALANLDALASAAAAYMAEPAVAADAARLETLRAQFPPQIKSTCAAKLSYAACRALPASVTAAPTLSQRSPQHAEVLLIGASTGGPKALSTILKKLPENFPVPIVVVQHMPPLFTRHFANRLNEEISLKVQEARSGMTLLPGHVFIAPGDYHLELYRHGNAVKTALQKCAPENSCRPAIDVLFRSAAKHYGRGCLAVILTGMGQDGLRGSKQIVNAGGKVLAQDEATSVVWGMPRAVAEAGFAEHVLPLPMITTEILRRVPFARQKALPVERIS